MDRLPRPASVISALGYLGQDIRDARRRRRWSMAGLAARAFISRTTLHKIENGDTGVSLGAYASVVHALGLLDRIRSLVEPGIDEVGTDLEAERLPKRIYEQRPGRARKSQARS